MSAYWAVVPAAGVGRRMNVPQPKQYLQLAGRTVIEYTLKVLLDCPRIDGLVVVVSPDDPWWVELKLETSKPVLRTDGGEQRYHSVRRGLAALQGCLADDDWVLVHDAARPCLRTTDLETLIDTLQQDPVGGLLAMPVRDTMKRADESGRVAATEDRRGLWHALTPQMFRFALLCQALDAALEQGVAVTDEASAVEAFGLRPRLVPGRADNIKITRPEDLALAEFYLTREHSNAHRSRF